MDAAPSRRPGRIRPRGLLCTPVHLSLGVEGARPAGGARGRLPPSFLWVLNAPRSPQGAREEPAWSHLSTHHTLLPLF